MGGRKFLIPNRNQDDQTQPRTNRGCQGKVRFISNPVYSGAFPGTHIPLAGNCRFKPLFVFLCTLPGSMSLSLQSNPTDCNITSSPFRPCQRLSCIRKTAEHPQAKKDRIHFSATLTKPSLGSLRTPLAPALHEDSLFSEQLSPNRDYISWLLLPLSKVMRPFLTSER